MSDNVELTDTPTSIVYLCDRGACGGQRPSLLSERTGGHDYCQHTSDIKHAVNFSCFSRESNIWFEKDKS